MRKHAPGYIQHFLYVINLGFHSMRSSVSEQATKLSTLNIEQTHHSALPQEIGAQCVVSNVLYIKILQRIMG